MFRIGITRRTFEASKHPHGSIERGRLNESAETSEYMPSHRYTLRTPNATFTYRTKREAEEAALRMGCNL